MAGEVASSTGYLDFGLVLGQLWYRLDSGVFGRESRDTPVYYDIGSVNRHSWQWSWLSDFMALGMTSLGVFRETLRGKD